ncbi:arsinothricin resistance N-acetyltransferase ArsN1 family A [Thermosediminibacter oceani]|uniref:GCN5-related N-acetyltransferase n=1 Tax=Thermosediminibacter oceani (strain ATCC BAA-1034 / DSM 16646 / JW/IW-1228P) TaxID=555079 RepID=D9S1V4_THEOJ|nr:arsinothricin resistance N-acetyltransferase ArsN1 family A [Thermosediminibacter oceani]ADL07381.1 GCN5-related N-acetyltransferase [Thermosediminibacter oceani DSM 16646]
MEYGVREATLEDIPSITKIYNQGIEDRIATLETRPRTEDEMRKWLLERGERYKVLVIEDDAGKVHGWASLNVFNARCCYSGVSDISIYIEREMRGKGLGKVLLGSLIETARKQGFHKMVLSVFKENRIAKGLYRSLGFREVGTYEKHGLLDGKWVDITIMERLL